MLSLFKKPLSNTVVFILLWMITFLLYLPAMEAGQVAAFFKDWLRVIQGRSFGEFLRGTDPHIMYQFTQAFTYCFYKLVGTNAVAWHLLHVTTHVACAFVFFRLLKQLLADAGVAHAYRLSLFAALAFCITAYGTEVVVHEPCYHYSLAFLMQLLIFRLVQKFMIQGEQRSLMLALFIFLLSSFSLELFYVTPWLSLLLAGFYGFILAENRQRVIKAVLYFFVPSMLIFIGHFLLIQWVSGKSAYATFLGTATEHPVNPSVIGFLHEFMVRFSQHCFNIIFMGRFWPENLKTIVYDFLSTTKGLVGFYGLLAIAFLLLAARFRKIGIKWKLVMLLSIFAVTYGLVVSARGIQGFQWVVYDRYEYFMIPFMYIVVLLVFYTNKNIRLLSIAAALFLLANCYLLTKVNIRWYRSDKVVRSLLKNFPDPGNKTVLLLNNPENMDGILMIGSEPDGAFKIAYNATHGRKLENKIYDVASFNMLYAYDGAHVHVVNDSSVKVILNQWGTWWWYRYLGGRSYENDDYKVDMRDQGHWYEITLKKPADQYLVLFAVGGEWRIVDMKKQGVDQN